jgi:predicted ATPase
MARIGWGRGLGGLPVEVTGFVGRRAELVQLRDLLEQARLVTLTGVGGVGKTRLALRAADAARAGFPDGVWLVELHPLQDSALVGHVILEALPLADQTTRPVVEVLAEWLADKRLLLVLDTCEHLIAACAQIVDTLLGAAPGLTVLATSRQALDLPDEREVEVQPLPTGQPQHGDAAAGIGAAESDAALLFAQRVVAAVPGFALDEGDREMVGRICRRLEGIPLAIELAAAQLPRLALEELERRLHARFELLTAQDTGDEAVLGRHLMLRTTIGWSHELCTPLERLLWARLSVFADGFDAEAAEHVCAGGPLSAQQIPQALNGLVNKSIVRREGQASHASETVRYHMLDTVREYGGQWLGELGEENWARRRHQAFYLHLARRGDAAWIGPDQVAWYKRMAAEHANLRAALDFSLTEPNDVALELAAALWFFWIACGFLREGRRYLERALTTALQSSPARPQALWACAVVALEQGDTAAGLRLGTACREAAQAQGDPSAVRAAAHPIGASLTRSGELTEAATVVNQALSAPGHGSSYQEAARLWTRALRGIVHVQLGECAQGTAVAEELRAECQQRGEQWMLALADQVLGMAALGRGAAASAASHARAALEGTRQLHDTTGIALAVELLAAAAAAQGQGERAARLLGLGQQIWQTIGRPQMGAANLRAAHQTCERQAREAIGDTTYEAAYKAGLESALDDSIGHCQL